jgi:hypothetical protein
MNVIQIKKRMMSQVPDEEIVAAIAGLARRALGGENITRVRHELHRALGLADLCYKGIDRRLARMRATHNIPPLHTLMHEYPAPTRSPWRREWEAFLKGVEGTDQGIGIQDELRQLQRENALLVQRLADGMSFRVSEKGAISIYGMRHRFPITLYRDELLAILAAATRLRAFIDENSSALK